LTRHNKEDAVNSSAVGKLFSAHSSAGHDKAAMGRARKRQKSNDRKGKERIRTILCHATHIHCLWQVF